MRLTNEQYDTLKWIIAIVLPALATLISAIGGAVEWLHTELVVTIVVSVTAFLGSIFMVSSSNYNKEIK